MNIPATITSLIFISTYNPNLPLSLVLTDAEIAAGKMLKTREAAREMGKAVDALLKPEPEEEGSEWDVDSIMSISKRGMVGVGEGKETGHGGLGVYKGRV